MASYSSYNILKAAADGLADAINYRTNLKRKRREDEYNYAKNWERNEQEYQRDLQRGRDEEQWNFDLKKKRANEEIENQEEKKTIGQRDLASDAQNRGNPESVLSNQQKYMEELYTKSDLKMGRTKNKSKSIWTWEIDLEMRS